MHGIRSFFRSCLFWVCSLAVVPTALAQPKSFSNDKEAFLKEMTDLLTAADRKAGKEFMEGSFAPAWRSPFFDQERTKRVVDLANVMLKKRVEAYPGYHGFLNALVVFATSEREPQFDPWMKSLEGAARASRKQVLTDMLDLSAGILKDNTFYTGTAHSWRSSSPAFSFVYDSVPKVVWDAPMDLICTARGDSAVIRHTRGVYYPTTGMWEGKGGRIEWVRAGRPAVSTWGEWSHAYSVRAKGVEVEVDSVVFTDPYFPQRMLGKVSDKTMAGVDQPSKATYPRFESYERRMLIKDIMPGVDFDGGFALHGARLLGAGTPEEPALLLFRHEGKPLFRTRGISYIIEPDKISSEAVAMVVHLDEDSIYHPRVNLRYLLPKKTLTILKPDEGLSRGPFYDTYHMLDMFVEQITWVQGDPLITLSNLQGTTQTRTSFESFNYFKADRYAALLGMDEVHPLSRVRDHQRKYGDVFLVEDFARSSRLQKVSALAMVIDLANKGFLDFDMETEVATIKPRLMEHTMASAKRADYDVLQLNSTAENGVNGTINLLNNDLALRGVARIVLSDSQDVRIFPKDQKVTVKRGRDMVFAGNIAAGKLNFYGKEYYFHYDPFTIDLLNVDSVSFHAEAFEADERGTKRLVRVKNVLEQVTGSLELDAPNNKSGLQQDKYPEYPKFNSTRDSYVYYDKKSIQKGAYGRDQFYYKSDPFQIDSLDNFTNAGLTFSGVLMSGGIFPDIREPLILQKDYALGFIRDSGSAGLPLYGKKAKFSKLITLDNKGLHGDGDLEYITTLASGKQFFFTPDTTYGVADTLRNTASATPGLKVPDVKGGLLSLRLEPAVDELSALAVKRPMSLFEGQATLKGRTILSPKGMVGDGLVDFGNATLRSQLFNFATMQVQADTSDFRLTEGDVSSIAFRTDNVNANIKLDERVGEFVSNGSETKVEFTVNKYICYMDRFKWFMDDGDIQLETDRTAGTDSEDLQLSGSNFISVHADQDSLNFMAPKARYDLKRHTITASEVAFIRVADAMVTPDSNVVRIGRNAEMGTLKNARIVANNVTKYHTVRNASVDIKARRKYSGSGEYDYVDETGKACTIRLASIGVDTAYQTRAKGTIGQSEGFQLSPAFDFYGEVELQASIDGLIFTGSTRIMHECAGLGRNWMPFSAAIDPKEVFIPVGDSLRDAAGDHVGAGLFITKDDPYKLYGTFLSKRNDKADRPVIRALGLLYYDKGKKEYVISNKDKIRQRDLAGDLVSLSTADCRLDADGHIGFGMELGRVKAEGYGTLVSRTDSATVRGRMTVPVDFHFHDAALEKMVAEMMAYPEQDVVDIGKTPYEKMMRGTMGADRSDKFISELSIRGEIRRLPEELLHTLVLADVHMRWNAADESWQSEGKIGLGSVGKKSVFRYVKGKVELERKRSGDVLTIMLMLDEQTYWYFQYARGQMLTFSSDAAYNTMISELKDDKTKLEAKKNEPQYMFLITNKRKVDQFRDRFGL